MTTHPKLSDVAKMAELTTVGGPARSSKAAPQYLALNANWLDTSQSATLTNTSNAAVFSNAVAGGHGWNYAGYWYPWYEPVERHYHYNSTVPVKPIKLTMSEVERLRVAAKKDKDLQKTLAKFTEHIEVVVDFE